MHGHDEAKRRARSSPLLIAFILLLAAQAASAQRRIKAPEVKTSRDGPYLEVVLAKGGGKGYLLEAKRKDGDAGRPGLLVVLHGHGGNPRNMMRPRLQKLRRDDMLSVQGGSDAGNGGFAWSARDTDTITELVRWVLATREVDPERVVVIGHSAGGTMALTSYTAAPELFAGVVTVSSPMAPTTAHRKGRVCVFYGTRDPNMSVADAVRSTLGGRNAWRSGCLFIVDGAEHNDLPEPCYLDLAVSWILAGKARGAEVQLPVKAPSPVSSKLRMVVLGYKGAEGYDPGKGRPRPKGRAKKFATSLAKLVGRHRAFFPLEAQAYSDAAASAPLGGLVTREGLEKTGPELAKAADALEPGHASKVIASARGFYVLYRDP